MNEFKAKIERIGINPFVFVPEDILNMLFQQSGMNKGHIPIRGTVNQQPYQQTLVKYKGAWRLYINAKMLSNSPQRIGEVIELAVEFDPSDRTIKPHKLLVASFKENPESKKVFDNLTQSKQQEIIRYISRLKTEESIVKNVNRATNFLIGKESFLGRAKP